MNAHAHSAARSDVHTAAQMFVPSADIILAVCVVHVEGDRLPVIGAERHAEIPAAWILHKWATASRLVVQSGKVEIAIDAEIPVIEELAVYTTVCGTPLPRATEIPTLSPGPR